VSFWSPKHLFLFFVVSGLKPLACTRKIAKFILLQIETNSSHPTANFRKLRTSPNAWQVQLGWPDCSKPSAGWCNLCCLTPRWSCSNDWWGSHTRCCTSSPNTSRALGYISVRRSLPRLESLICHGLLEKAWSLKYILSFCLQQTSPIAQSRPCSIQVATHLPWLISHTRDSLASPDVWLKDGR